MSPATDAYLGPGSVPVSVQDGDDEPDPAGPPTSDRLTGFVVRLPDHLRDEPDRLDRLLLHIRSITGVSARRRRHQLRCVVAIDADLVALDALFADLAESGHLVTHLYR